MYAVVNIVVWIEADLRKKTLLTISLNYLLKFKDQYVGEPFIRYGNVEIFRKKFKSAFVLRNIFTAFNLLIFGLV